MCSINPKFEKHFILSVYTSYGTKEEFEKLVKEKMENLLQMEIDLNKDMRLRWILGETNLIEK